MCIASGDVRESKQRMAPMAIACCTLYIPYIKSRLYVIIPAIPAVFTLFHTRHQSWSSTARALYSEFTYSSGNLFVFFFMFFVDERDTGVMAETHFHRCYANKYIWKDAALHCRRMGCVINVYGVPSLSLSHIFKYVCFIVFSALFNPFSPLGTHLIRLPPVVDAH